MDRRRAVADGGAETVGARVAATDDDDVLAGRGDRCLGEIAFLHLVGPRQVLHRLMDAGQLAAGDRQIAPKVAPPASTTAS